MYVVRYVLYGETPEGLTIRLFDWCRDEQSGIKRAEAESKKFGIPLKRIWAIPV